MRRIRELIGTLTCNSDSISIIYNLTLIITPVIIAIISRFLSEIILIISHQASLVIEGKNILARSCSTCKNGHLCQLVKARAMIELFFSANDWIGGTSTSLAARFKVKKKLLKCAVRWSDPHKKIRENPLFRCKKYQVLLLLLLLQRIRWSLTLFLLIHL